jgi:hypothetical protein
VEEEKPRMTHIDKAELISFDKVKRTLRRALKDTDKIDNLPPLPSKIKVTQVGIKNCSATKDGGKIKVHGKGWVDLDLIYKVCKKTVVGELQISEDFPITYSAEFANDKTLLSCKAVVKR